MIMSHEIRKPAESITPPARTQLINKLQTRKMKSIYVTLASLLLLCCFTYSTAFVQCKAAGKVNKLIVNGKDSPTDVVILKRGQNASLEVDFMPGKTSKHATSVCHGIISGLPVPFPVVKDGCKGMSPHCPIQKGAEEHFNVKIDVKKIYPKIKLAIKWEEKDDNNEDIFCIVIPAEIED